METLRQLETTIASWYKKAPHLPGEARNWIAKNAWWIVIVLVVFLGLGVMTALLGVLFAGAVLTSFGGAIGAAVGGFAVIAVVAGMFFSLVCIILAAMAISPLKALRKKGWNLLFLIVLIEAVSLPVAYSLLSTL